MGFWVTLYRIRGDLPEDYKNIDLEVFNTGEIVPGLYHSIKIFHVEAKTVEELKETVENTEELVESDIVGWEFDDEALKHPSKELAEIVRTQSNFFIMKVWGLEQVAIDKEMVFIELSLQEVARLIESKWA